MSEIGPENVEKKENGCNVTIILKIIRHGERIGSYLTDYGRDVTKLKAHESGIQPGDFDAIKAVGSNSGSVGDQMGRSLESADIYADEIDPDRQYRTKAEDLLNFKNIVSPRPYNHEDTYNTKLPANFNELSDEDQSRASKVAQHYTVNYLLRLNDPVALAYKREATGAFAQFFYNYQKAAKRYKNDSRVLLPSGSHGGFMELPLQYALVRKTEEGDKLGFESADEIGGEIDPSEAFNVIIETDEHGEMKSLKVTFDEPTRPQDEMYLDPEKLEEARLFWESLHTQPKEIEE